MKERIKNLKGKLIVSYQALPDEPLHSSFIGGLISCKTPIDVLSDRSEHQIF